MGTAAQYSPVSLPVPQILHNQENPGADGSGLAGAPWVECWQNPTQVDTVKRISRLTCLRCPEVSGAGVHSWTQDSVPLPALSPLHQHHFRMPQGSGSYAPQAQIQAEIPVLRAPLTHQEFGLFGPDWPILGHVFIPELIPATEGWGRALLIGSA